MDPERVVHDAIEDRVCHRRFADIGVPLFDRQLAREHRRGAGAGRSKSDRARAFTLARYGCSLRGELRIQQSGSRPLGISTTWLDSACGRTDPAPKLHGPSWRDADTP